MHSSLQVATQTNPRYPRLDKDHIPPSTLEPIALPNERCMSKSPGAIASWGSSPLLHLIRPSFNSFAFAPNRYIEANMLHSLGIC